MQLKQTPPNHQVLKDCKSSSEGGTKGTCGFLQGKKEAQQELGFKGQAMLTSHLSKDKGHPGVPVSMPTHAPGPLVITHPENLHSFFSLSKQEFYTKAPPKLLQQGAETGSTVGLHPQAPQTVTCKWTCATTQHISILTFRL